MSILITPPASGGGSGLPSDSLSIPGAFGIIKNPSDTPIWARSGQAQVLFLPGGSHTNGTGATVEQIGTGSASVSQDGFGTGLSTGTTTTGGASIRYGTNTTTNASYTRAFQPNTFFSSVVRFRDAISDGTNGYLFMFGIHEEWAFGSFGANAIYLAYNFAVYGDHNIRAVTRASGTSTTTDTGVTVVSDTPISMAVLYESDSSVKFYLDDVLVATHTTNIPAESVESVMPAYVIKKTVGTSARRAIVSQPMLMRYF